MSIGLWNELPNYVQQSILASEQFGWRIAQKESLNLVGHVHLSSSSRRAWRSSSLLDVRSSSSNSVCIFAEARPPVVVHISTTAASPGRCRLVIQAVMLNSLLFGQPLLKLVWVDGKGLRYHAGKGQRRAVNKQKANPNASSASMRGQTLMEYR